MKHYPLITPKDAHGQPLPLFKCNVGNNISKAIDQLSGICSGILADGIVNEFEGKFFAEWVRKFASLQPVWPFTDILARVERIFADGHCPEDERAELQKVIEDLCGQVNGRGPNETRSTLLPLDQPQPEPLTFTEQQFVVTGRFAYGTRQKVIDAINVRGGFGGSCAPDADHPLLGYRHIRES